LPKVPSSKPSVMQQKGESNEDDLTSRLAALKDGLPKTVSLKPPASGTVIGQNSDHQENDVENWCIICCDDASLKCLDCDGDLYCHGCWTEGHIGIDAPRELKTHRAVIYRRSRKESHRRRVAA